MGLKQKINEKLIYRIKDMAIFGIYPCDIKTVFVDVSIIWRVEETLKWNISILIGRTTKFNINVFLICIDFRSSFRQKKTLKVIFDRLQHLMKTLY